MCNCFQGRNGDIRYSIRTTDAVPAESLDFFYVNPLSGDLSVIRALTEDQDQPDQYRVCSRLLLRLLYLDCVIKIIISVTVNFFIFHIKPCMYKIDLIFIDVLKVDTSM